ncbi:sugar kinase [Pseudoduganella sp. S-14]|jgi:2-dehydro-3-deoxygluconokinase|uniref:sugar kinase n=1 Tax=Pseudoduganella sp. S-14 TaxID=3404065 RepID=UPI003CFA1F5E
MNGAFWSVGECMLELRPQSNGTIIHAAAGDSYNTAVYLKRLAPALPVRYVSALGDDAMSILIRKHMRAERIDDSLVETRPGGTPGLYAIETDANGERRFAYWRAQSAARSMLAAAHLSQLEAGLAQCRALLLTGITLAILDDGRRTALLALAEKVRAAGGWVALDNNYRSALWDAATAAQWMDRATRACTHALFSFEDEAVLHGAGNSAQALQRIESLGVPEAALKLGAGGCLLGGAAVRTTVHVPAPEVQAVDTTAAGDSFNAGYLAQRLAGANAIRAAQFACTLAAAVVGHHGAIIPAHAMPPLPDTLSAEP